MFVAGHDDMIQYLDLSPQSPVAAAAPENTRVGENTSAVAESAATGSRFYSAGQHATTDVTTQHLCAINAQMLQHKQELDQKMDDLLTVVKNNQEATHQQLSELRSRVEYFGSQPFRSIATQNNRQVAQTNEEEAVEPPPLQARLSKMPRTLFDLWKEYTTGLNGHKAAKDFTRQERGGKTRYVFYKRNVFWAYVKDELRANPESNVHQVIDELYARYGRRSSVTTIIKCISRDKNKK